MARVSSWTMNGDTGVDAVGSNTLTKQGTVVSEADSPIPGETNTAGFAGAGRYELAAPTSVSIKDNITIGGWFNWSAIDTGFPLAIVDDAASNYFSVQIRSGKLGTRAEDGGSNKSLDSTTTVVVNTWYWLVWCLRSGTPELYVNGERDLSATTGAVASGYDATPYVVIGAKTSSGVADFNGNIYKVFYNDDAMSAAGIAAEYAGFFPSGEPAIGSPLIKTVFSPVFSPMEYRP